MTTEAAALARELRAVADRLVDTLARVEAVERGVANPAAPGSPARLLTAAEVAVRLALPKARIYALAREGRIGGTVRIGSQVRFDPGGLDAWVEAGGASGGE